ncbi:MAG: hypothetical protein R2736_16145 [Solirubrobacterales bacterium]
MTVSGTAAVTTTISAAGSSPGSATRNAAGRALSDDLLEVHLVRDRHLGAAVDQGDVVGLAAQQKVERDRRADAAPAAHDRHARAPVGLLQIVRHYPAWVDSTAKSH